MLKRPQVILADDDDGFRAVLGDILTEFGYDVLNATNGVEALRLLENHPVAGAIVDLVMPEQEGLETIFRMRQQSPQLKIIAVSGGARGSADTYLQMARQIGADAALAKPFGSAQILDVLRRVLPTTTDSDPTAKRA